MKRTRKKMKIEVRSKIPVTPDELREIESVSRDRLSETLFEKPKHSRAKYDPVTHSFESYMESIEQ